MTWQAARLVDCIPEGLRAVASHGNTLHAGQPEEVLSAVARSYVKENRFDQALRALLLFPDERDDLVQSRVYTCMAREWVGGMVPRVWELPYIEVEADETVIYLYNTMLLRLYHYIGITDKATGKTTIRKQ
ncbi:hypothetical protein VPNG_09344 [Cytospora leucostoma]|uniref:Uncharacterized protein n=1 Tax=Cytospora leucostoma TaxID=1230097 RepID=A0A423VSX9_9PEZI|nr:hypothetical protein VPNG_09344 [Cytospora leucostoma]